MNHLYGWLAQCCIASWHHEHPRREGPERYAQFVAQGRDVKLWEEALSGQIYLGDEEFIQRMQAYATLPDDVDYVVYSFGSPAFAP